MKINVGKQLISELGKLEKVNVCSNYSMNVRAANVGENWDFKRSVAA